MAGHRSPAAFISLIILGSLASAIDGAIDAAKLDGATASLRKGKDSGGRTLAAGEEKQKRRHVLTLETPQVEHKLVICNAYTSDKSLDIVQVRTNAQITGTLPLSYKQCREFAMPLEEGDQLDFKAGNLDVGSFYATGLPKTSTSLLLVPHRREPNSAGVRFESHAFADMQNPQIAVVDAYKGQKSGAVKIIENRQTLTDNQGADNAEPLEESLNFNSVVAINPGRYHVALFGTGHDVAMPLSASNKAKYVVMRVGNDETKTGGSQYGQELIVFPSNSGAHRLAHLSLMAALVTFVSLLSGITG